MPHITIHNRTGAAFNVPVIDRMIPRNGSITAIVDDTDEVTGDERFAEAVTSGLISYELGTDDTEMKPIPVYATAALPLANSVPTGSIVFDSTRDRIIASIADVWHVDPSMGRYATGSLPAAPVAGTVAFDTTLNRMVMSNGTVWFNHPTVSRSTTAQIGAYVANTFAAGSLAFDTDLDRLVCYTGAVWFNHPTVSRNTSVEIAAYVADTFAAGSLAFDTTLNRLVNYTGTVWFAHPTVSRDTTAAINAYVANTFAAGSLAFDTDLNRLVNYTGAVWFRHPTVSRDTTAAIAAYVAGTFGTGSMAYDTDRSRLSIWSGAAWVSETTVGMYATGAATALNGVVVMDPTGYANANVGRGRFQVYNTAAAGGAAWVPVDYVVPTYINVGAFPVAADVPEGTLAVDLSGGGGALDYLYVRVGGAWVPAAA